MRTLTTKEYELISKIYNSTDEIEASLSFELDFKMTFTINFFILTRKQKNENIFIQRVS